MLTVKNLDVFTKSNKLILNDISFSIEENTTLCVLGESGSGKSVLAYSIMDILHKNLYVKNGEITFFNEKLTDLAPLDRRKKLGLLMSLIMQNPMTALDPTVTLGKQIDETIKIHNKTLSKKERTEKVFDLLKDVGLTPDVYKKYPFEVSGGMAQKVVIAIAIANNPKLIIADEPITALDRKSSYEILSLLKDNVVSNDKTLIYISHDIDSILYMADNILVLYKGYVVEFLSKSDFINNPLHPYTKDLSNSVISGTYKEKKLIVPKKDSTRLDSYCIYYEYCTHKTEHCQKEIPLVQKDNHIVRCINAYS